MVLKVRISSVTVTNRWITFLWYFVQEGSPPVRWLNTDWESDCRYSEAGSRRDCKAGFEQFCTNIVHTRCFTILQPRYGLSQFLDCKGACIHLYGFFVLVELASFRQVSFLTIPTQDFIEMLFPPFKHFLCSDDFIIFLVGISVLGTLSRTLSDYFGVLLFPPLQLLFPRSSSCVLLLSFSIPYVSSGTFAVCFPPLFLSSSSQYRVLAPTFLECRSRWRDSTSPSISLLFAWVFQLPWCSRCLCTCPCMWHHCLEPQNSS